MLRNWVGWGGWVGDGWSCPLDLDPHFNTTSWVSWYPSTAAERWRHSSVESGANWPHARKWAGGRWLPSLMTYWLQAMPAEKCNPMATPWSADNALIQLGRYPNRAIGNPGHRDPSKPCAFQRGSTQNPPTSPLKPRAIVNWICWPPIQLRKHSRKLTAKAPETWCLGKDPFLLRYGLFSGCM